MALRIKIAAFFVVGFFWTGPTNAADLKSTTTKEGKDVVHVNGEIAVGDAEKFLDLVRRANSGGRAVSGVRLNSPGGNLAEGLLLAEKIRTANVATVVANGTVCASACFLAFAAGSDKYVSYSARVGVHGASDKDGRETVGAAAATVGMARSARELGVPAVILGKMVTTPPDQMVWLSPDDLRAMGAKLTGTPNQTNAPALSGLPVSPQAGMSSLQQAATPKNSSWEDVVASAVKLSAAQNGGAPKVFRVCQPEMKICNSVVLVPNNSGDLMVRTTTDVDGKIVKRDFCNFNVHGDIRKCYNWDTAANTKEMKNSKGEWINVD